MEIYIIKIKKAFYYSNAIIKSNINKSDIKFRLVSSTAIYRRHDGRRRDSWPSVAVWRGFAAPGRGSRSLAIREWELRPRRRKGRSVTKIFNISKNII